MLTGVDAATALVLIEKVALVAQAGTVPVARPLAAAVLLLESATCAPPAGAASPSVTVPVEEFPPVTVAGFSVSEETAGGDVGATGSIIVWPLLTWTCEMCCPP